LGEKWTRNGAWWSAVGPCSCGESKSREKGGGTFAPRGGKKEKKNGSTLFCRGNADFSQLSDRGVKNGVRRGASKM